LLLPAIEAHQRKLGRVPGWVAADAGFYSRVNEEKAKALGVKYVSIPNRNTRSEQRRRWKNSVGSNAPKLGARVVRGGSA